MTWFSRILLVTAALVIGWFVSQNAPGIETSDMTLVILLIAFMVFALVICPASRKRGG